MAKIYKNAAELVGNTPLLEVGNIEKKLGLEAKVLVKLEYFNPAGSAKDRIALSMIEDAEEKGILKPGAVIIEPTSGNTGIGLASLAAIKGYKVILTMPETMSVERRNILKAYGAEIVLTEGSKGMNGAIAKAKELAEEGHPSGTFVVADQQTAGKGRRGRSWDSLSGTGIYMTLMLKPDINPNHASMLTLVTAMAVANAMHRVTGAEALIKWPNDIVINGKKICGILTEMSAQFDYINHIVIGIGINVHNESFPEELQDHAGSLLLECGKRVHRADLIEAFLEEFERLYAIYLQTEDLSALQEEYDQLLVNRGRQVRVLDPKEPFEGKAMGITKKGELIVDTWESRKLVSSGEVSVRGIYGYV